MKNYQQQFIELSIKSQALQFGNFTLKSGRISPYFFNMGCFHNGTTLRQVGECYAALLQEANFEFDTLFGPAYKGIPLVCSTVIALSQLYQKTVNFSFNRKEAKDHGEGGNIVGASINNRVVIIDDVITAGTAFREAITLIKKASGKIVGLAIALDRQERGQNNLSALAEISEEFKIPVVSLIKLENIIEYLTYTPSEKERQFLESIEAYRKTYGMSILPHTPK